MGHLGQILFLALYLLLVVVLVLLGIEPLVLAVLAVVAVLAMVQLTGKELLVKEMLEVCLCYLLAQALVVEALGRQGKDAPKIKQVLLVELVCHPLLLGQ